MKLQLSIFTEIFSNILLNKINYSSRLMLIFILLVAIFAIIKISKNHREQKKLYMAIVGRKQFETTQIETYNKWYKAYIDSNGMPDKTIPIVPYSIVSVIHVHETTQKVYIQGQTFAFKQIIGYSVIDNSTTLKGKITATTKSSSKSTIKRAIAGQLIAGSTGAIIGGTTGKKQLNFTNRRIASYMTTQYSLISIVFPIQSLGFTLDLMTN